MAKTKEEKKYNNIVLIPTDFSEVCGNAVSHGVKLAKFLGYKVCILHIIKAITTEVTIVADEDIDISTLQEEGI